MPNRKEIKASYLKQSFIVTTTGFALFGASAMGMLDVWGGYAFTLVDYLFPVSLGFTVASSIVAISGTIHLLDATKATKLFTKFQRSLNYNLSPFDLERDGGLSGAFEFVTGQLRVVNYDKWIVEGLYVWPVFVPKRKKPVIIDEDYLMRFLKIAWNRQQDWQTKNAAFSRPHFTRESRFCTWSEYHALIGIVRRFLWGRGDTESGFSPVEPVRMMARVKAHYPNGKAIKVK